MLGDVSRSATACSTQCSSLSKFGVSNKRYRSKPYLLSICNIPEEVIKLEAGRAYLRIWAEAGRVRLDDVAFLECKIKVWYEDTESKQGSQQR